MVYDAKTPAEYLAKLDEDWRKNKLFEVRDMIQKNGPELIEGIHYKMLSYSLKEKIIFSLNAQKAYVSLYVGDIEKVDGGQNLLEEFNIGKGCIRIKKSILLKESNLEKFIKRTLDLWRAGGETNC